MNSPNSEDLSLRLAQKISRLWNLLAKTHGWRQEKTPEEILKTPKLLHTLKTLALQHQQKLVDAGLPPKVCELWEEQTLENLQHLLTQWNWEKSPAPLRLLTSPHQWQNLTYLHLKNHEETQCLEKESLQRLLQYTQREWDLNQKVKKTPQACRQATEEHLQATGKWDSLTPIQKTHIQQLLDKLSQTHA
jgi:hypothetical protein